MSHFPSLQLTELTSFRLAVWADVVRSEFANSLLAGKSALQEVLQKQTNKLQTGCAPSSYFQWKKNKGELFGILILSLFTFLSIRQEERHRSFEHNKL